MEGTVNEKRADFQFTLSQGMKMINPQKRVPPNTLATLFNKNKKTSNSTSHLYTEVSLRFEGPPWPSLLGDEALAASD